MFSTDTARTGSLAARSTRALLTRTFPGAWKMVRVIVAVQISLAGQLLASGSEQRGDTENPEPATATSVMATNELRPEIIELSQPGVKCTAYLNMDISVVLDGAELPDPKLNFQATENGQLIHFSSTKWAREDQYKISAPLYLELLIGFVIKLPDWPRRLGVSAKIVKAPDHLAPDSNDFPEKSPYRTELTYPDGPELNHRLEKLGMDFRIFYAGGEVSPLQYSYALSQDKPMVPYSYSNRHSHDIGEHIVNGFSFFPKEIWAVAQKMARFEQQIHQATNMAQPDLDQRLVAPTIKDLLSRGSLSRTFTPTTSLTATEMRRLAVWNIFFLSGQIIDDINETFANTVFRLPIRGTETGFSSGGFIPGRYGFLQNSMQDFYSALFDILAIQIEKFKTLHEKEDSHPLVNYSNMFVEQGRRLLAEHPDRDKPLLDNSFYTESYMNNLEANMRARLRGEDVQY